MSFFDDNAYAPQGGPTGGGGGYAPPGQQVNQEGAGYDPFAYTKGSLLTPWEGKFSYEGGDGGPGVAEFRPFEFDKFGYNAASPDAFAERYNDPGNFVYGDYNSGPGFKAPTEADMKADPSYKHRMKAGERALSASKAAQGILKTGGTAKALMKYGQETASNEYGAVYGRKANEFDRSQAERRHAYGTNRQNNAENWNTNVSNQRQGHQIRQQDWRGNADVALDASRHGYDVAQGTYDRNLSLARGQHDDLVNHENAVAAAGAASAARSYDRAMNEYTMGRDEFWTNQDRQHAILDRERTFGYGAAQDYVNARTGINDGRANAQASGYVGAANARSAAAGNIGGTIGDLALYGGTQGRSRTQPQRPSAGYTAQPPYRGGTNLTQPSGGYDDGAYW